MMILEKRSSTSFKRDKKGKVVKVIRSGHDDSIDEKVKEFNRKRRAEARKKRKKYYQKQRKAVRKEVSRISRNANKANDWLFKNL